MSIAAPAPRVLVETVRIAWLRDFALVATATGLIAAMAQVSVRLPFSPVPVTGQTFAVLLACASLGVWRATAATSLYLGLALAGLPVLAPTADGGHITGVAVLSMASLGYVLGFIVAAIAVGRLAESGFTRTPGRTALAMVAGNLAIYAVGLPVLKFVTGTDWATALSWGVTPFLIGDALKIALAAGLLPGAWALLKRLGVDG